MLLHLTVVENDNTRVSVILLLHLVFRVDALPLNLGKHTHIFEKQINHNRESFYIYPSNSDSKRSEPKI